MFRVALASLRHRKALLLLSSLAIALGVAFVTGTLTLGASVNQAFFDGFAAGAKHVDAAVTPRNVSDDATPGSPAMPFLPGSLLAEVRQSAAVASAQGRIVGQAALLDSEGKVVNPASSPPGIGINAASDPELRGFSVASGHVPDAPDDVAVDTATAADEHFRLGQYVKVVDHTGRVRAFHLVGTVSFGVNHEFGNSTVTVFTTSTAFAVTGRPGYDEVVMRAAPGLSQSALVSRIGGLPGLSNYQVQTGSQFATAEADSAVHFTKQFTTAILIFALIALVVACIVIYNTFTILTAQRGTELAMLRCVGATRRQIFAGTLLESMITGLVASVFGAVAGVGLAWAMQRLFSAIGTSLPGTAGAVPSGPLVITVPSIVIAIGIGIAVTLAAAIMPARAATRVPPVAAVGSQQPLPVTRRTGWPRVAVAAVFGAGGILLAYAGTKKADGTSGFVDIAIGGCVFFVAVLALGPLIVAPVITFFGWLPGVLFGVTAKMASVNARRNPHRVAATSAALTIAMTLMTVFTIVVSSAEASTSATIQEHYPFDYAVQASKGVQTDPTRAAGETVPPQVLSRLQASPELGSVAPFYEQQARVGRTQTSIGAIGQSALGSSIRPAMNSGSLNAIGPRSAAIDISLANALGVHRGGTITISTPDAGSQVMRIVAVYDSAGTLLPTVLETVGDFLSGFRPPGANAVLINAAQGVPVTASRAAVDVAAASDPLLIVNTEADYRASLSSRVSQVLSLFGALLGLALLIALFGVSNTLTLSVIERTRESALMRALGLTQRQLRRMLFTEAVLMALLAVALGVGLGASFGWAMVEAFINSIHGGQGVVSVPYAEITIFAAVGICTALLAAVHPARRIARVSLVAIMAGA